MINLRLKIPGCDNLSKKLKYIEGHKHCNLITKNNTGYMFGAMGMSDSDVIKEFYVILSKFLIK